jgi:hypothetical protein
MNMQSEKTKRIIYWVLTSLISMVFLGSAASKFNGSEEALKMAGSFGLDAKTFTMIGVLELSCLLLFIIPRTGVIGTLLLAAYMGGAIATHLQHGVSIVGPCVIQGLMFLVAFYRFPELRLTLFQSNT